MTIPTIEGVARGLAALTGCDADEWPMFKEDAAKIIETEGTKP